MRRLIDRCAGIDVGQALLAVCLRVVDDGGKVREQVRSFAATTPDLQDLREWLTAAGATRVAMESTGVYWKAPYYLLEDAFEVLLVNAAHLNHVPGRKTDPFTEPRHVVAGQRLIDYGLEVAPRRRSVKMTD